MKRRVTLVDIASALVGRAAALVGNQRLVVGMGGAPGSGKSTMAEELCHSLNRLSPNLCAILPMDGFHYDDGLLNEMGRRAHKGAPDTFDVGGLLHCMRRLSANDEEAVAVPVFDRTLEISRGSARLIKRDVKVILVEGNYLLLREAPWQEVAPLCNVTVLVTAQRETLRRRLQARWRGFNLPEDEVRRKVEENDLPNADYVLRHSAGADYILETD